MYIRAMVRQDDHHRNLSDIITSADPPLQEWLSINSGPDISMFYILRSDNDRAEATLTRCLARIVEAWSTLSPLAGSCHAKRFRVIVASQYGYS